MRTRSVAIWSQNLPNGVDDSRWQVPAFRLEELAPRRTKYVVAVPVINEGPRLLRQLERMKAFADIADIVIADGGSTDGSNDPSRVRDRGVRAVLVKTGPGRLGAQIRMAFAYAMREGYAGCILIDGNDKDDPAAIPRFIAALDQGCDFVQGSRFLPGGAAIRNPLYRVLALRLIHAPLLSFAAGVSYTDTTNGFRAYSRRFLLDERVAPFREVFSGYELHYYLSIRAGRLGFRTIEIPVMRRYPATGPTPTKISLLRGNLSLLAALLAACLGRYDP